MIALSQRSLLRTVLRLSNRCLFSKGIEAIILVAKQQIHDETENNGSKSSHCTDNSAPIRLREVRVAIVVNNGRKGGHGGRDGGHGWEGASVEGKMRRTTQSQWVAGWRSRVFWRRVSLSGKENRRNENTKFPYPTKEPLS